MKNKRNIFSLIAVFALSVFFVSCSEKQSTSVMTQTTSGTIYFVRHAQKEKGGADPSLTMEGNKRAQELAVYLKDLGIEAVYATQSLRANNTAQPMAASINTEVLIYDKKNTQALMEVLLKRGGNHLVVGHWDTANNAYKYFGEDASYDTQKANDSNNILKLSYKENKVVEAVLLPY